MSGDAYGRFVAELRSELAEKTVRPAPETASTFRAVRRAKRQRSRRRIYRCALALAVVLVIPVAIRATGAGRGWPRTDIVAQENRLFVDGLVARSLFEAAYDQGALSGSSWFETTAIADSVE